MPKKHSGLGIIVTCLEINTCIYIHILYYIKYIILYLIYYIYTYLFYIIFFLEKLFSPPVFLNVGMPHQKCFDCPWGISEWGGALAAAEGSWFSDSGADGRMLWAVTMKKCKDGFLEGKKQVVQNDGETRTNKRFCVWFIYIYTFIYVFIHWFIFTFFQFIYLP